MFESRLKELGHGTVETACNATLTTNNVISGQQVHSVRDSDKESSYFTATLSAIGELHLRLDTGASLEQDVGEILSTSTADYLKESDGTFTTVDGVTDSSEDRAILR